MTARVVACFALLSSVSTAQEVVREAPISHFSGLPNPIKKDLLNRGCTVPQPPNSRRLENIIRGRFRNSQDTDWAVLCDVRLKNTSMILVYWNGSALKPSIVTDSIASRHQKPLIPQQQLDAFVLPPWIMWNSTQ